MKKFKRELGITIIEYINNNYKEKEILKKKKMTQTDLANQLGTTRQNLNNKMARDNFTIKELSEIARVLESEIIFRDDNGVNHIISYVPDETNSNKNDEKSDFS